MSDSDVQSGQGGNGVERPFDGRRIVVSLTSYPPRMATVHVAIESLLEQTLKPDLIVLYLYKGQFPHRRWSLPKQLKRLVRKHSVQIKWVDTDLMPHKKYFWALREYADDLVVTVDDDLIFPPTLIETLVASYNRFPKAISAMRTHLIMFTPEGELAPYDEWIFTAPRKNPQLVGHPSRRLFATTGAGTLFPPSVMPQETFDEDGIRDLSLHADDVWINFMRRLADIEIVAATSEQGLIYVPETQDYGLWVQNISGGNNDRSIHDIYERYRDALGADLRYLFADDSLEEYVSHE